MARYRVHVKQGSPAPFRRSGVLFGRDPQVVDASGWSEEQVAALLSTPCLEVEALKEGGVVSPPSDMDLPWDTSMEATSSTDEETPKKRRRK